MSNIICNTCRSKAKIYLQADAIDSKWLAQHKLSLGDTGAIIDERGRFAFKPGFATAIGKVLGRKNTSPVLEGKRV